MKGTNWCAISNFIAQGGRGYFYYSQNKILSFKLPHSANELQNAWGFKSVSIFLIFLSLLIVLRLN